MISSSVFNRMNFAIKMCSKSTFPTYKMAAILFSGNKPLIIALNKLQKGEVKDDRYLGKACHAELNLIIESAKKGRKLNGETIYVAGLTRVNNLVLSKPCKICQEIIKEAGIKKVYYHDKDGKIELMRF